MTVLLAGLWTLWAALGALWLYYGYRLVQKTQAGDDWASADAAGGLGITLTLWVCLTVVMWGIVAP